MSERDRFKFRYTGQSLRLAAEDRVAHHQSRLDFWTGELATADAILRSEGVSFQEYQVTGGTRVDPAFDPRLKARYDECRGKVTEHTNAVKDYERWVRAFELNEISDFDLDINDVAYFAL